MKTTNQIFILDEWLWHDLFGENGEHKRKEAFKILVTIKKKCDKIATIQGSMFEKKFYHFCKQNQKDTLSNLIVKFYKKDIFLNSNKYIQKEDKNCPEIPEEILTKIKQEDQYIVKLYYILQGKIITTDNPLLKILEDHHIPCEHRDNFLLHYIKD